MNWRSTASPLAVAVVLACSNEEQLRRPTETTASSVTDTAAQAETGHTEHAAAELATLAHEQHAETRPPAGHAAHGDTRVAAAREHAAHMRADTLHARHAQMPRADSAHAMHAQPAPDTGHAAHALLQTRATAHAQHPQQPTDTTHAQHGATPDSTWHAGHEMAMIGIGGGWMALGMAQVFPTFSFAAPASEGTPLERQGVYATQPAIMFNVESRGSRITVRTTLNFEGITQPEGELTYGGWGEGFLDKRHPHTFLHEAMLSFNVFSAEQRAFSLSLGKGFAPYGTDDPMMRPVVKYPTNHHLSQILERWNVSGVWLTPGWSVEAGVFGGNEPTDPWDMSNIESFPNSWSARITRRFGPPQMGTHQWELGGSFGRVQEEHDGEAETTNLYNAALRHERSHGSVHMYTLLEGSWSDPQDADGYYSVLGEGSLIIGPHKPYGRIEFATRPEYAREGPRDTPEFFRYDHDADPLGSTRWLIVTAGYGFNATTLPFSIRPYFEAQYNRVRAERGGIDPVTLFERDNFWSLSAGFRIFLGGEPMRMGQYGVLDPMTRMHRMQMQTAMTTHEHE